MITKQKLTRADKVEMLAEILPTGCIDMAVELTWILDEPYMTAKEVDEFIARLKIIREDMEEKEAWQVKEGD